MRQSLLQSGAVSLAALAGVGLGVSSASANLVVDTVFDVTPLLALGSVRHWQGPYPETIPGIMRNNAKYYTNPDNEHVGEYVVQINLQARSRLEVEDTLWNNDVNLLDSLEVDSTGMATGLVQQNFGRRVLDPGTYYLVSTEFAPNPPQDPIPNNGYNFWFQTWAALNNGPVASGSLEHAPTYTYTYRDGDNNQKSDGTSHYVAIPFWVELAPRAPIDQDGDSFSFYDANLTGANLRYTLYWGDFDPDNPNAGIVDWGHGSPASDVPPLDRDYPTNLPSSWYLTSGHQYTMVIASDSLEGPNFDYSFTITDAGSPVHFGLLPEPGSASLLLAATGLLTLLRRRQ